MRLRILSTGAGGLPSQGREFSSPCGWPGSQARQHVIEVFPNVDCVSFAGLDHRRNRRHLRSSPFSPNVQPIFAFMRSSA